MAKKDFSKVPAVVTLKNATAQEVKFRYFRVNFVETLAPEDEVVLTIASSEEVAYYTTVAEQVGLTVTVAEPAEENA